MKDHLPGSIICLAILSFISPRTLQGQNDREQYVSSASYQVGTYVPASREHTPQAMTEAAVALIDSLDESQSKQLCHAIDSPERRMWTNLPAPADAGGLRFGLMNDAQVRAACDLMATLFSEQGYTKICNIMLADDQLLRGGRARPGFGTGNFSIVVFGEPSIAEPWAVQIDGHHVGVNVAINGENLTMSPSFIGSQPEAFNLASRNIRPLGPEIDQGYALVNSLADEQRKQAVLRPQRGRILTGPGHDNEVPKARGVSCKTFSDEQQTALLELIGRWVNDLPQRQAAKRMAVIKSEIDQTYFAWNGETDVGSDISWRIQGPSLIIEYACQDMGGNPLNHLHTMYRDPTNEYGKQIADK